MKQNNKGFTFVEILAVIVLIGVLSSIAIIGVTRYRDKAKDKDYEALAQSSYNAMEEYILDYPYSKTASLEMLEDGSFLSNRKDPATKKTDCTGSVEVNKSTGTGGKLDDRTFTVYLCCTNYKKKYTYPGGKVENYTGTDKCSAEAEPDPGPNPGPDPDAPTPNPGPDPDAPTPTPGEETVTCNAGNYLPKNTLSCQQCLNAYYCPGGTFKKKSIDQGLNPCPTGYKNSKEGSSNIKECFMKVNENYHVKESKDSTATKCNLGYSSKAHNVYYENTSSCELNKTKASTEELFIYYYRHLGKSKDNCNMNNNDYNSSKYPIINRKKPYRIYEYHSYLCKCDLNDGGIYYLDSYTKNPEERNIHEKGIMVIFYKNNKNGEDSCKHENNHYINQNVETLCFDGKFKYDDYENINNINYKYEQSHGYRWYKDQPGSSTFSSVTNGWYHNKGNLDDRYKPANPENTIDQRKAACQHACKTIYGK